MASSFHRVIPDFMIQGGDPTGTGAGARATLSRMKSKPASSTTSRHLLDGQPRPGTNGSQFFITHVPTSWLDGKHTVFGEVTKGQDIVNAIKQGDKIESIVVLDPTDELFQSQADKIAACETRSSTASLPARFLKESRFRTSCLPGSESQILHHRLMPLNCGACMNTDLRESLQREFPHLESFTRKTSFLTASTVPPLITARRNWSCFPRPRTTSPARPFRLGSWRSHRHTRIGSGLSGGSLPIPAASSFASAKWIASSRWIPKNSASAPSGSHHRPDRPGADAAGLFYPPDPGSMRISTIGLAMSPK